MSERKYEPKDYEQILTEDDFWRVQIKDKRTQKLKEVGKPIISHDGCKKLAGYFGVYVTNYRWLKEELSDCLVMVEVTGFAPWTTPEVGECNKVNAGQVGGNYPHSMAWKRGYDRAVLMHLGIIAFSEEETEDFRRENFQKSTKPQEERNERRSQEQEKTSSEEDKPEASPDKTEKKEEELVTSGKIATIKFMVGRTEAKVKAKKLDRPYDLAFKLAEFEVKKIEELTQAQAEQIIVEINDLLKK